MTRIYLVRHGQTAWNASGRFMGQADISLNETGLAQAAAVARRLAGQPFDAIYSSDLLRARATAEPFAAGRLTPIQTEPRLRELHFGTWQGLTYSEIAQHDPQRLAAWQADPLQCAPPGGETLGQMLMRLQGLLSEIRGAYPEGDVLLVSHGGPLRTLVCSLLGLPVEAYWRFKLDNGSLSILELFETGAILNRLNDTAHLEIGG